MIEVQLQYTLEIMIERDVSSMDDAAITPAA